jgi:PAS domain S-box-containing protein
MMKVPSMLSRLRLTNRLVLIYLLSFVSVVPLAYSLVREKSIAIEFAQKEQRGSAYVAVVRDALLAVIQDRLASATSQTEKPVAGSAVLREHAAALEAAERRYGRDMSTAALAGSLVTLLRQLSADAGGDLAANRALHTPAMMAARQLISRIGDQSNLILDPDLDGYYTMSIVMLRLPELVTTAVHLADTAAAARLGPADDEARVKFLLTDGAFAATISATMSDAAAAYRGNSSGDLQHKLGTSFDHAQKVAIDYSDAMRALAISPQAPDADLANHRTMLPQVLAATSEAWRQAGTELDGLLQQRIDGLYRRMASDLGMAALAWLLALGLVLVIARQITRPIRNLAAVAERVRYGEDYNLRAQGWAGGEIGSLIDGFNAMLDRLQREAVREQERVARDHAATVQRELLEAIPIVISVAREADGRILYTNIDARCPSWLPDRPAGDPPDILGVLHPADRTAFLDAFRVSGQVDGFEARCQTNGGAPFWVLIGARAVTYQGESARLNVYTPINDRKRAEATLARRNALLDAITYAATRIVGTADWKLAIPELLARLGTATDASRAFIFEIHPAPDGRGLTQSCRFSWAASDIAPIAGDARYRNDLLCEDDDSQFVEWFHRRRRGEVIQVTREQTRGAARTLFEESDTYSMLSVPLLVNGAFWGTLGFDDCRRERIWDDVEIDLLTTAAVLISAAIERAMADERLRERDSQLIEAQRIAHVGSWELDFKTDEVSWSDEGWRIFGLEPGRDSWSHTENLQRIHPDDRQRVADADAVAQDCRTSVDMEYRILRPDGEVRVVRERAESICDETGRPIRLIGTVHDVTELKATEARLRESEERYALAARGADVGLWDWDIATDRAYLSPRLHEILETGDRDLRHSISALFDQILPEDLEALQQHLKGRFASQRRRFEFEVRTRTPANTPRWLVIRGLIVYADARPIRLVGSLGDITDRKRAQEEVIRQREALYQNEKMAMFGSLLAGVAHELNNPLSVVIGQIVLLQQTVSDPAVIARAERIRTATERCARIVRTFLAMARQRHADPKPVQMNSIVEMAVELLAHQLRSANIRVELDLAADLPTVAADADQIHQVLTNLLVNARQALSAAATPGRIQIATRFDHRQVDVSIRDNGPGVPEEFRKRIFEPFFTTKPVGEGTGIGLSLCSSIIHAHGGRIDVSENAGGGAAFTVVLPLGAAGLADPDEVAHTAAPAGLRVLIVDDEAEIADTLNEILRSNGHEADVAADGRQGLERALSATYDLILSDMRMPVLDGPGFYRALQRARPDLIDRLAFITGDTLSVEIQSFLNQTSAPYLEKPFLPDDVLRLLSRAMERQGVPTGTLIRGAKRAG